jgi:superfamily II DNA or RNA helicase
VEEILNEEGRKMLILSERVEHLELLKKRLDEREIATSGFYVGGMKQSKLDETANCQVIFGTFQMASEGLDIKGLNTLVMALPRREIEQTIGRITRDPNSPVRPLVIDITDDLESFVRQSYVRRKYYRTNGFQIKYYEVNENEIVFEEDITTTHVPEEKKSFGKIKASDVDF